MIINQLDNNLKIMLKFKKNKLIDQIENEKFLNSLIKYFIIL